jgi:hypothetical protein
MQKLRQHKLVSGVRERTKRRGGTIPAASSRPILNSAVAENSGGRARALVLIAGWRNRISFAPNVFNNFAESERI